MHVLVNGKSVNIEYNTTQSLRNKMYPNSDIVILNGFQTNDNIPLKDGDSINYIEKGVMPPLDELESMISSRHTPKVYNALKSIRVKVSHIDVVTSYLVPILARVGVGTILIPSDTKVSPIEVSIGDFLPKHLHLNHLEVLKNIISSINPFVNVEPLSNNYDIIITNSLDLKFNEPTIYYNYGNSAIDVHTKELSSGKYMCGCDNPVNDVTSAYAMVLSGHIANLVVNLSI